MIRLSCECKNLEEFYCKVWQRDGIIPTDITVLEVVFRLDSADYVIIFSLPEDRKMTDVPIAERQVMTLETIWRTYLRGTSRYAYPAYKQVINMQHAFTSSVKNSMLYKHEKKWKKEETLGMQKHGDYLLEFYPPKEE